MVRTGTTGDFCQERQRIGNSHEGIGCLYEVAGAQPCPTPRSFQALRLSLYVQTALRDAASFSLARPHPSLHHGGGRTDRRAHAAIQRTGRKEPAAAGNNASTSRPARGDPDRTLMAVATLLIFVAVLHRYGSGVPFLYPIPVPDQPGLGAGVCIYMFVWMAKFGAAYGVRTGIHVGVDVLVNQLGPRCAQARRPVRPVLRRAVHRRRSARWARNSSSGSTTPIRCRPISKCRRGSCFCASRSAPT